MVAVVVVNVIIDCELISCPLFYDKHILGAEECECVFVFACVCVCVCLSVSKHLQACVSVNLLR